MHFGHLEDKPLKNLSIFFFELINGGIKRTIAVLLLVDPLQKFSIPILFEVEVKLFTKSKSNCILKLLKSSEIIVLPSVKINTNNTNKNKKIKNFFLENDIVEQLIGMGIHEKNSVEH